jgi:5'-nucleotidase
MNLFFALANLSTSGLLLAGASPAVDTASQAQSQPPAPEEKITKVTVQPGDFLSKIAKKYDTTWRRIYDANNHVKNPDVINPGD